MSDNGRSRVWLWVLIGGGAFFLFVLAVFTLVFLAFHASGGEQSSLFGDKIGVVDLDGVILSPTETVEQLRKFRNYYWVVAAGVAGLVTPPDPASMIALLVPMILLYEVGIWTVPIFIRSTQAPDSPEDGRRAG